DLAFSSQGAGYAMNGSGSWFYEWSPIDSRIIQGLNEGQSFEDRFTVYTADGTAQVVTITINGVNDAAGIDGDVDGVAVEDTAGASGNLDARDADNTTDAWQTVSTPAESAEGYGTYTVAADGAWTYHLNNDLSAVQALNTGERLTDRFVVRTED